MRFGAIFEGKATGNWTADELESHLEAVLDELMENRDAIDPTLSATLTKGDFVIEFEVGADTFQEAQDKILLLVRSAIHAAGGATPDWPASTTSKWEIETRRHTTAAVDDDNLAVAS